MRACGAVRMYAERAWRRASTWSGWNRSTHPHKPKKWCCSSRPPHRVEDLSRHHLREAREHLFAVNGARTRGCARVGAVQTHLAKAFFPRLQHVRETDVHLRQGLRDLRA